MAGEVALEQSSGVALRLALGDPLSDVVLGGRVVLAAVQDDRVEARLSCRSPPRLSRCRLVWPLEAGIRATRRGGQAASERSRPWCDQATISWAATIGPTPGSSSSRGASARTCPRISCSRLVSLDGRSLDPAAEAAQHEPCRDLVGAHRA
ncbi:MAG: hypothetical protein WKH64_19725 [Chloroflexia bacterium]